MNVQLNRISPVGPAQLYRSYVISAPLATHWRPATCREVSCEHFARGWAVSVLPGSPDETAIRSSGRRWQRVERVEGGFLRFEFPAGQACFAASRHRVPMREPRFLVKGGDHRGNPLGLPTVQHSSAEAWRDDLGENQDKLAELRQRG